MTGLTEIVALPRGARFHRADLHIHSFGGSHDVRDRTMTPQNIVDTALAQGLGVIAVTDHNEINNVEAAMKAAEQTIYHGRDFPSHVLLPVIPDAIVAQSVRR